MISYVGDDPKNEVILKGALERSKFGFSYSNTLTELAANLEGKQANVIFVEHPCHLFDAFEICKLAVKNDVYPILVVRELTEKEAHNAIRTGVVDIMVCPFSEESVIQRVNKLVGRVVSKGKSFKSQISEVDHASTKSIADKVKMICQNAKDIMSLPPSVAKIVQLCNQDTTNASQLEAPVKADSAVAAMVLKRANCASSASVKKISSVQDAIVRIGLKETRSLALLLPVFNMMSGEDKTFGFNRTNCWLHSLTVAVVASILAQKEQLHAPEDAFLAGLLHDLGKALLDDHLNAEYAEVIRETAVKNCRIKDTEKAMFKQDHSQVGAAVAETWQLPQLVLEAVRDHHKPIVTSKQSTLANYVSVGNSVAKSLGIGHSGDYLVEDIPRDYWMKHFGENYSISEFVDDVFKELKHYSDMLEMDLNQLGVTWPVEKKEQSVVLYDGGASSILEAFFVRHGYSVDKVSDEQLDSISAEAWIAVDGRVLKGDFIDSLIQRESAAFVLQDGDKSKTRGSLNIVSPPQDFDKLNMILNDLA